LPSELKKCENQLLTETLNISSLDRNKVKKIIQNNKYNNHLKQRIDYSYSFGMEETLDDIQA
jgi:hypothetical protein